MLHISNPLTRQHVNQILKVVAVDRADVVKAQLLKQRAACPADHSARILVDLGGRVLDDVGQLLGDALGDLPQLAQLAVCLRGEENEREISRHPQHIFQKHIKLVIIPIYLPAAAPG